MSEARPSLLLVGGSTRAAAWSAIRAGRHPICADFFADEDLRAVADVLPLKRYPQDVVRVASTLPAGIPWMYAGGVENHPRLIAALAEQRPLLGIPAASVRRVRNPRDAAWKAIASTLAQSPVRIPAIRSARNPPPAHGTWVLKPLRGSAGRGIVVWDEAAHGHPTLQVPHFFQQRVTGQPISAIFVASANAVEWFGFSQQWIGETICHAFPFQYCGSIGPIDVGDAIRAAAHQLAQQLADQFGLRGVFGCDFLLDGGIAWLTEVNPRYTASVEVFEFAGAPPIIASHLTACGLPAKKSFQDVADAAVVGRKLEMAPALAASATGSEPASKPPTQRPPSVPPPACVGKAILYAPSDLVAPHIPFRPFDGALPEVADIPQPGSRILAGAPICTVFASGRNQHECERLLQDRVTDWAARLR